MTIASVMRPCSRCYRMRQTFKDGMGRVFQRSSTHTEYTLDYGGVVTVDNETHKVVGVVRQAWGTPDIYGREVYAAGGRLIDVETTKTLAKFTRSRRLHIPGM